MNRLIIVCCLVAALLAGCAQRQASYKGGKAGSKPYTIAGKTYYPLQSAHSFVEEGIASWYGPGFHGKATASGETYNQYAMTAAHKILPLGTTVRVTHLESGKSALVRINDRGPFVDNRVIDLSRAAATRLDMMGKGTARVRVQSIGDVPKSTASGSVKGSYYIQVGSFSQKENARKLANVLENAGQRGRLFQGRNKMWIVQIGPWPESGLAQKALPALQTIYPHGFVVRAD
ncbi:MAG: septal ring lytic transglycosylase RlpA family protein [Desulfovibrio sp.]|nr:septal ring lytic transglycosylase RlpA family protein [Desulfovibrio sp.]